MDFEKRTQSFQNELETLQQKHSVQIYATQALLQNGELVTLIKLKDLMPQTKVVDQKSYEGNTKSGNSAGAKTQKVAN